MTGAAPPDFEKLGAFYLGRVWDPASGAVTEVPLLYDAKDLTTHGVVVGMTGSGKTGLAVGLIEEAAIDGVPALVIDPKGDMGNLMLSFPRLRPEDFEPWIDPAEAGRAGETLSQYAATVAARWKKGLAEWGQDGARVERFRQSTEITIYTPGSSAGVPLTVLESFAAPPEAVRSDADLMRDRVAAAASGLLALLGIDADPIQSREHILLSNLFDRAWRAGEDLDLARLIQQIQAPPFEKLGVVDVESFFPAKQRTGFAMQLNNLLASPSFASWLEGEPLEMERLLYTREGRPRVAILSLAHLSESERMFVVTLVLNEMVSWIRSQSGTSSLRALLYMDEIFGYFPPSAEPPSKKPMLTLLKQARAFGVGVLLATQNPVDLDYKGLSNCGSWFVGRLQTERDKERLLDGLMSASGGALDRAALAETIGGLGKRVFLLNNIHEDGPVLFQTRWALSYLRGPLVRDQISTLMKDRVAELEAEHEQRDGEAQSLEVSTAPAAGSETSSRRPSLPPGVEARFLPADRDTGEAERIVYRPMLYGRAQLHFKRAAVAVDEWIDVLTLAPIEEGAKSLGWDDAREVPASTRLGKRGLSGAEFDPLPAVASRPKAWGSVEKKLISWLYRTRTLDVFRHPGLKMDSRVGETESEFRRRLKQEADEERDRSREQLRARHAKEMAALVGKIERAQEKVDREKSQFRDRTVQTAISFGSAVIGALFSRKLGSVTNVRRASTTAKQISRGAREKDDVERAEESLEGLLEQREALEARIASELEEQTRGLDAADLELEILPLRPTKSDTVVAETGVAWTPWSVSEDGTARPLWSGRVSTAPSND